MTSSPQVRDLALLDDPKIRAAMISARDLNVKRESLYLESLYENPVTALNYGSAVHVSGDLPSTLEVGLHAVTSALAKHHWSAVVDPNGRTSSLALYEAAGNSPRFVCVRTFSDSRFVSVVSHLVGSFRVVVAHVPTRISSAHMAKLMARVRENNSIVMLLDPAGLCEASFDRRIVARTVSFSGVDRGAGVLTSRTMEIEEFEHGVRLSAKQSAPEQHRRQPLVAVRSA